MAMAATDIDRNGDVNVDKLEFKSSPNVSMDGSQALASCDEDIPVPTMETSIEASSKSSLHDEMKGESDYDFVKSVEIDENSIPSVIEEIYPVDGPCVQCEIEQPCSFRFTDNGQTLYVCNEPCIKAYQAEYPGKYSVTRMKYIIEEITPKTFLCSECEQNKTCYFYHTYDGEETYYCSLNCLDGMMADEKDKYTFKLNNVHICINQIRPKEGQCLICEKVKPCEFSMVRYGETCFLCERTCIKVLSVREHGRYYISKQRVNIPAVTTALDNQLDEGYNIQAKAAAMAQREQSFHRRCSQCTLILMIDENVLTWEAMDFCDEICLERFQKGIGSKCAKCESLVQRTSLGKYCVRFGYDIRQFCNSSCLEEFKKGLKICYYCQKDISASTQVFLAAVGDEGQLKDFCAQACVAKFDQMSRNPKPQPVWAKCAVCSLEKATTIEMEVSETDSQRLCSDTCFAAFTFAKNIVPDQCKWCKKYFERKPTQSFTTYDDDSNPNCFCSLSCMTIHIHHTRFLVSCNKCKTMKYNIDMIRRADNDQAVMMCSLSCLNLYQESLNAQSSTTGAPASTLATPIPSIEQGRADVITLAAEQLITLTQTRKRRKTTQSSKQEEPQIINLEKLSSVKTDSPPSGRKKEARRSRLAAEQLISTLTKSRKRSATTQSSKQEEPPINKSAKICSVITDSNSSGKKEAGSSSDVHGDPLKQIRTQRIITQRRMAALPVDTRRELITRQWEAHLERMLLPDAPPRKRQTKKKSPERQPCIMAVASTSRSAEPSEELERGGQPSIMAETSSSRSAEPSEELERGGQPSIMAEASSSRSAEPSEELERGGQPSIMSEASSSRSAEPCSEEVSFGIGAEVVVVASPSSIGVNDMGLDCAVDNWLQLPDSDDDNDLNNDDDVTLLPTLNQLRAETEPAVDSDLTQFQAEVLRTEDDANDRALRDLIPDDSFTFNWSKDRRMFLGRRETFTGTSGPTFDVTNETRPIDIFDKMFDTDFIDRLCVETNRNADQKIALLREQGRLSVTCRFNRWTPTNRDEMVSFLTINILQGLYPLPEEEAYFGFNGFGTLQFFARIMSYNRFILIKKFLHFVDTTNLQDKTKLGRIRPIVDYLNDKFSSLYMPSQEIAIDESLLKWLGRLSFTQKISSKAAQVGVKTYELCESSSGYLWKFYVYTGKDTPTTESTGRQPDDEQMTDRQDDDEPLVADEQPPVESTDGLTRGNSGDRPTNATARIVFDLVKPLLHRGHTLIMDNFYNSPLLLRALKRQQTDCYGTLRLNREFVPDSIKTLTKTDLRRGEVVATYCSDLSVLVWRDANIVSMISTYHNLQIGTQDKYNRLTYKPKVVLDYNKSMGGVDRKDQFLAAQPMERLRNRVWYKKLFRRLYNAALFNCFVIFSSHHLLCLLQRHRQLDLTSESRRLNVRSSSTGQVVTTTTRQNSTRARNTRTQARPTLDHNHFPIRTGSKHTTCFMCPGKKRRTIWKCEECDVNLCIEGCFKAYHKP